MNQSFTCFFYSRNVATYPENSENYNASPSLSLQKNSEQENKSISKINDYSIKTNCYLPMQEGIQCNQ